MSELLAETVRITKIIPHNNADRLEIATIKGWPCIVPKGQYKEGQMVVYFPPDTIMPYSLHAFLNITNYCASLPKSMNTTSRRVKAVRLRGIPSYGVVITTKQCVDYFEKYMAETSTISVPYFVSCMLRPGFNVAKWFQLDKWQPMIRCNEGNAAKEHPRFYKYTSIEHWRNYPNVLHENEQIIITEKIHGTNCRLGFIEDTDEHGNQTKVIMAGSHKVRRQRFHTKPNGEEVECLYWQPFTWHPRLRDMLLRIDEDNPLASSIMVYGEIYGRGVQNLHYDATSEKKFRVFDIAIDGYYLNYDEMLFYLDTYKIPFVPVLYVGPYSPEIVERYTVGNTLLTTDKHIREGCVIKPIKERDHPKIGRVILKSVSVDYLSTK